jgi:hypothetical protein
LDFSVGRKYVKSRVRGLWIKDSGKQRGVSTPLIKCVRDHPEEFLAFPIELGDIGHNKEPHRPFPLDTVRQWGLKFTLGDSVHSFFERLGELKSAYEVSEEARLRAVPELLKG